MAYNRGEAGMKDRREFKRCDSPRWVRITGHGIDNVYRATNMSRSGIFVESFSEAIGSYSLTGDFFDGNETNVEAQLVRVSRYGSGFMFKKM
jgi:hypothetical protein